MFAKPIKKENTLEISIVPTLPLGEEVDVTSLAINAVYPDLPVDISALIQPIKAYKVMYNDVEHLYFPDLGAEEAVGIAENVLVSMENNKKRIILKEIQLALERFMG